MSMPEPSPRLPPTEASKGVVAALISYGLWGFLPLLFRLLESAGSVLIVAERTLWSLVLLGLILAFMGGFGEVRALFAEIGRAHV